ncbi:MAG: hypothetical protein ACLFM7_07090, partial [Bacteroidales bacterium]
RSYSYLNCPCIGIAHIFFLHVKKRAMTFHQWIPLSEVTRYIWLRKPSFFTVGEDYKLTGSPTQSRLKESSVKKEPEEKINELKEKYELLVK